MIAVAWNSHHCKVIAQFKSTSPLIDLGEEAGMHYMYAGEDA